MEGSFASPQIKVEGVLGGKNCLSHSKGQTEIGVWIHPGANGLILAGKEVLVAFHERLRQGIKSFGPALTVRVVPAVQFLG
jgi:hypothetical protein